MAGRGTTIVSKLLGARKWLANFLFDRFLGVDTRGRIELGDLGLDDPERTPYEGTGWRVVGRLLGGTVTPQDVFLDIGSGKGRALLQAARLPFRRVVGVELSPELSAIARRNVERSKRWLRCRDVAIITGDAITYHVPDDVTVAFLFNPFTGETLDRVIQNLLASIDRRPRRLRLLYVNPTDHARLIASTRIRLVRSVPVSRLYRLITPRGQAPPRLACVYELLPASAEA